jgi:pyruvate dehydrogenase E1 component alpha subunit
MLLDAGHATEDALATIEKEAGAEADDAVDFAFASPPPDPSELFEDIYAEVRR